MKKVIAAVTTAVFAVALAIAGVAVPASAHTPSLSGVATCDAATGTWSVNWTYGVTNVPDGVQADSAVTNFSPTGSTFTTKDGVSSAGELVFSATAADAGSHPGVSVRTGNWSVAFTQSGIPGNSTQASVEVTTNWTDPTHLTDSNIVKFKGTCAKTPVAPAKSYVIAAWSMPSWVNSTTPTWAQKFYTSKTESTPSLGALDSLLTTCGTQYQVDVYNDSATTASLLSGKVLNGPNSPKEDLIPGGWGVAYKLVQNKACAVTPPCITSSHVSYTYHSDLSKADGNSGDITVAPVTGSSGTLCNPFWVTAASWKYTSKNTWPQTLDEVDKLAEISKVGVYHFAAPVTCGQGDVYADFTSQPNPSATLTGPSGGFTEHFLHQMGFTGPNPTYAQTSTSCWTPGLTPETGTPTFVAATCTATDPTSSVTTKTRVATAATTSDNTVTLPAVPGGVWTWTKGSDSGSYGIGAGYSGNPQAGFGDYTYTLTDGDAHDLYKVTGTTTTWTPFDATTYCVTPGDPTFAPQTCDSTTGSVLGGSITVALKTGLVYEIQGGPDNIDITNVSTATTTGLKPGDYVVSVAADAAAGYQLNLSGATTWPVTITIDAYTGECTQLTTHPLYHAGATGTAAVCVPALGESLGTINLAHSDDGTIGGQTEAGKVKYTITNNATGDTMNEATTVDSVQVPAGDYTVQGVLVDPTDGLDVPNTFTIHIAAATGDCQLDTDAALQANATGTTALCTPAGGNVGTITLEHVTPQQVDYTLTNNLTGATTDLGTTATSVHVAAGHYTVTAKAVNPADTIQDANNPDGTTSSFAITINAVSSFCSNLQSLAFTGVSAGIGFTLAGSMLFLGLAGLFMRRRFGRSAK